MLKYCALISPLNRMLLISSQFVPYDWLVVVNNESGWDETFAKSSRCWLVIVWISYHSIIYIAFSCLIIDCVTNENICDDFTMRSYLQLNEMDFQFININFFVVYQLISHEIVRNLEFPTTFFETLWFIEVQWRGSLRPIGHVSWYQFSSFLCWFDNVYLIYLWL